jgi:DNA polymerase III subunit gamma/tau
MFCKIRLAMAQIALNLARKWRSAQFKEIIGQDLVVRILQNSLFKNQFFPVYLFSGQRGCGKTSTARVFASALNCQKLSEFQTNAKISIPCLVCASCQAMTAGRHPDFIEIDAASYTGVDNIRNIIDTSSFLPVIGQRKIYLIDEVHMLSKAAFNAFLKILEEPPKFVVFILATTEAQKLPDTVRSRCFQLFFNPVNLDVITLHLENMCKAESINYDRAGLEMIASVCQGSLRDAINLLEQARFADSCVTKPVVLSVLGYLDDSVICTMLEAVVCKDQSALFALFASWSNQVISTEYVVKRCIELLYDCLVLKYGATPKHAGNLTSVLETLVQKVQVADLVVCFDELCSIDMMLGKTGKKQLLFESLMVRLSLRGQIIQESSVTPHHETMHDEKKKSINHRAQV